ncbi:MAG: transposase [Pseudomonadota bacterium]
MRHEVIFGVERRRRWSDEDKLAILMEVGVAGATVADVARAHDLTRQHIYQWRRQMREKGLFPAPDGSVFLALDGPEPAATTAATVPAEVEIGFANGRSLRCRGGLDDRDLARLIRLVETA